jgi:hypothetical protein
MDAMNDQKTSVWEIEHCIETNASPEVIWALFKDVLGWKRWNSGIEEIEMPGDFVAGTFFLMKPPGQEPLKSRLLEVTENAGFLDETCVGDLKVYVDHRITEIAPGRTKVTYSLEAFGPSCDEIGPLVSADFPDVLKALVALAEREASQAA